MINEIILYETSDGKCPIKKFLDSLSDQVFKKVSWILRIITELDRIPTSYFKKLKNTEDIWECRIRVGSNIYRIFCFFIKDSIVVLTHGITKKSQKTPRIEIDKAMKYKTDFLRRYKNGI